MNRRNLLRRLERERFNRRIERNRKKGKMGRFNLEILDASFAKDRLAGKIVSSYKAKYGTFNYWAILEELLPSNLKYILTCKKSDFHIDLRSVRVKKRRGTVILNIPKKFSLIDAPDDAFAFLRKVIISLLCEEAQVVRFDYQYCEDLNIGAQVLLDIILIDVFEFYKRCKFHPILESTVRVIKGVGLTNWLKTNSKIQKALESVGSPAIHLNVRKNFPGMIPYRLCVRNREERYDRIKEEDNKAVDTSALVQYVVDSLKEADRELEPGKLRALGDIIGEVLINASEHSTTSSRYSIGYFQKSASEGLEGVFRLVILNFGQTIYEKFADPSCPNQEIVAKMRALSSDYTERVWFAPALFEEETLWTLYALQEGVSSVGKNRGTGSIQFIDQFFSLSLDGAKSRMAILSGNTSIVFDGTYKIVTKKDKNGKFKMMTFNESGKIEDPPDQKFVNMVPNYFPGTIISALIVLSEKDLRNEN